MLKLLISNPIEPTENYESDELPMYPSHWHCIFEMCFSKYQVFIYVIVSWGTTNYMFKSNSNGQFSELSCKNKLVVDAYLI